MIQINDILDLITPFVKEVLEKMLVEERNIHLENNPHTKANGFYERDLKMVFGELNGLKVPRTRDGKFKSTILPHRKHTTKDLNRLIRAMLISGISTRKKVEVLKELYGFEMCSSQISRISQVTAEEIQKWRQILSKKNFTLFFTRWLRKCS